MSTLLRYELEDADAVAREYATHLRHGRALVPVVADAELLSEARLELVRASDGARIVLDVRILMFIPDGPSRGTAVELVLGESERERLERFAAGGEGDVPEAPLPLELLPSVPPPSFEELPSLEDLPSLDDSISAVESPSETAASDEHDPSPSEPDAASASEASDVPPDESDAAQETKIVRIRKLGATERARLARTGHLEDRVLLERVYGKDVWEELLRNPQLTVPEVARIAAKGTVPRIMLETIVDNAGWSKQPLVRRALLSNPRLSSDAMTKLLRATPKNELKLIVQGTAYPVAVRGAAKKMLAE